MDTIIEEFNRQGYIIDWIDFYESSVQSGWNVETTLKKIEYSLIDIKEKEYCNSVLERLKLYIMVNEFKNDGIGNTGDG